MKKISKLNQLRSPVSIFRQIKAKRIECHRAVADIEV
jgi:hypothetical protein